MGRFNYKVGEIVYIKKVGVVGEIVDLRQKDYKVQSGQLTTFVSDEEIEPANIHQIQHYKMNVKTTNATLPKELRPYDQPREFRIDLHGYTMEQATIAMNEMIDEAKLYQAHHAFIIHGKGTGTLRQYVQKLMRDFKSNGRIKDFEYASVFDGGHGVTIVYF